MSHFLARLVERTRGIVPRVEPIIAPRFAAAPPLPETAVSAEAALSVQKEIPQPETPEKSDGKFVRHEDPAAEAGRKELIERTIPAAPETLLVPAPPQPKGDAEIREHGTSTRESGSLRRDVSPHLQSAAAKTNGRRASHDSCSTIPQPSAFSEKSSPPPNENAPNERPIIRVTIGRIEVRAMPAATPPPRKTIPAAAPLLDLDAYARAKKETRR